MQRAYGVKCELSSMCSALLRMCYLGFIQVRLMIAICGLATDAHKGAFQGQQTMADKTCVDLCSLCWITITLRSGQPTCDITGG